MCSMRCVVCDEKFSMQTAQGCANDIVKLRSRTHARKDRRNASAKQRAFHLRAISLR